MKYEHRIGMLPLAFALLCGACSSSTSSSSSQAGNSGGKSTGNGGQTSSASSGQGGSSSSSSSSSAPKCDSVQACGGDVVGTWDVTSSCLNLDGEFVTRGTGLGCDKAKITGSLQVKGSFVATGDKKFQDKTITSGPVTVTLAKDCLFMSGTWTQCDLISVAIEGLGFKDIKCADAAGGGCTCPGTIDHEGNMGLIVAQSEVSGEYTVSGSTLGTGENPLTGAQLEYSYCVANGRLTLTPKTSSPPTSGTIVFKKAEGTGGSGGNSGGSGGKGGTGTAGSSTSTGGTTSSAGALGGVTPSGGTSAGGTTVKGGTTTSGASTGGASGGVTGGSNSSGSGTGGSTSTAPDAPCDILETAKTPCVGAYSVVRAIYKGYNGPLYQVRSKTNTSSVKDVPVLETGGYADSKVQDDFCATPGCTVSKIYDQSPKGNHLLLSPDVCWLSKTGNFGPTCKGSGIAQKESDVKSNPKLSVGGHTVYGLRTTEGQGNCYRIMKGNGVATGEEPEFIYAVYDSTKWTPWCCYDFGNAESTGQPDGYATMEAIYYGNATMWGKGAGNGPWFSCDYEAVVSPGGKKVDESIPSITSSMIKKYATFMLKGFKGDRIALKYGDAQKGGLTTQWDGNRANEGRVTPMKKQGSIILGSGGDGSYLGGGVFFEGAITAGVSDDKAVDDAIQANIVAAGYKE